MQAVQFIKKLCMFNENHYKKVPIKVINQYVASEALTKFRRATFPGGS